MCLITTKYFRITIDNLNCIVQTVQYIRIVLLLLKIRSDSRIWKYEKYQFIFCNKLKV